MWTQLFSILNLFIFYFFDRIQNRTKKKSTKNNVLVIINMSICVIYVEISILFSAIYIYLALLIKIRF